jgi:Peptidase A4 family
MSERPGRNSSERDRFASSSQDLLTGSYVSATLLFVCLGAVAGAPASALAETGTSSNWSGYLAHRTGVSFRRVQASWIQPNATCDDGEATYSAFWVGLGGTSSNSDALEQIGTELDCSASGAATSSAWFALVPSPAKAVRMTVESGDEMSASLLVSGHRVTLRLTDRTRHGSWRPGGKLR